MTSQENFEARRIKSPADDLTFPSNNVLKIKKRSPEIVWDDLDEGGSKVIIPKENFVFQNTDSSSVVVFAYKNQGNILPSGTKKGQNRQWVRSITATKKVERVNSPVISVSIYDDSDDKYRDRLEQPLTFILYHKEIGYNAKCFSMVYGNPKALWNEKTCKKMNPTLTANFTECRCDYTGSVAVITTMGEMPTPFPEYALETIIIVANGLAAFLTAFTFVALCLRRITTDHYFVCSNLNLSMSLYFVMVVIALNMEKETKRC
ncbi:uncharacterized protein [Ptychodera flava]|uniref:uncharacterized protein n=1 Tax=Ptychodera flava TaxID=63121 RepID=UPI00396AAB24